MFPYGVDFILDILLPSTDNGVFVQFFVFMLLFGLALWRFWQNPEIRIVAVGIGLIGLGLMGWRALH